MQTDDIDRLIAVTAHELRSPLSTILGYQELLTEGLVGSIDQAAREALERIRSAALQLLAITHGLEILAGTVAEPQLQAVRLAPAFTEIGDRISADAAARGIDLTFDAPPETAILGEPETIARAIELALHALLKAHAGTRLRVLFETHATHLLVHIVGDAVTKLPPTALRPLEDTELDAALDGVGLRFAIVRRDVERIGGTFQRTDAFGGALTLRLKTA